MRGHGIRKKRLYLCLIPCKIPTVQKVHCKFICDWYKTKLYFWADTQCEHTRISVTKCTQKKNYDWSSVIFMKRSVLVVYGSQVTFTKHYGHSFSSFKRFSIKTFFNWNSVIQLIGTVYCTVYTVQSVTAVYFLVYSYYYCKMPLPLCKFIVDSVF